MPSPFPGMNPYFEQVDIWPQVHHHFCSYLVEALVPQVRPDFFVKLGEHVYIHDINDEKRRYLPRPDFVLAQTAWMKTINTSAAMLEAPCEVAVPLTSDIVREAFIEICDVTDQSVVTVLELLSPTNKCSGSDREQFL